MTSEVVQCKRCRHFRLCGASEAGVCELDREGTGRRYSPGAYRCCPRDAYDEMTASEYARAEETRYKYLDYLDYLDKAKRRRQQLTEARGRKNGRFAPAQRR